MHAQDEREMNSLERYITGIRSVWGDGKDPQLPEKVKEQMQKMLRSTNSEEFWMAHLIKESKAGKELYRDPDYGFVQMGHIHRAGHRNQPHDHGPCWVVYGVYQGAIEIKTYERTDDGKQPGVASLAEKAVHQLTPGVVYPYLVGEIHSTRAVDAPAVVFRFLSYDLNQVNRHRYDPEKRTVVLEQAIQS